MIMKSFNVSSTTYARQSTKLLNPKGFLFSNKTISLSVICLFYKFCQSKLHMHTEQSCKVDLLHPMGERNKFYLLKFLTQSNNTYRGTKFIYNILLSHVKWKIFFILKLDKTHMQKQSQPNAHK